MTREIHLVRHGETESNVAHRWEGFGDSPLSERGRSQAAALAGRIGRDRYDLVVASDLGRAVATAERVVGDAPETDPAWREANLGRWEGLTHAEVLAGDGPVVAALAAGEDVAMGGGESPADLGKRAMGALQRLAGRLDDGQRALVVTHGGVVTSVVASILGLHHDTFGALGAAVNTSITRIRVGDRGLRIDVYNDCAHIGGDHTGYGEPGTQVLLIRHGETEANRAGVWQGRTDGSLTERGTQQAQRVAAVVPPLTDLYASTLSRAAMTAAAIGERQGLRPTLRDDLVEIDMGAWEGLSPADIQRRFPQEWSTIIEEQHDLPRGGHGETFAGVTARMTGAVDAIAAGQNGGPVGIVSHGGALRAYVSGVVGLGFAGRRRLASPDNTSITRVILGGRRPRLAAYNVSAHLD